MSQKRSIQVVCEHFETLFNTGSGSETGFSNSLLQFAVTDNLPFDHVDHLFGDIGGMVCEALQVAGDQQQVDHVAYFVGVFFHGALDAVIGIFFDGIDFIVQRDDLEGQVDVEQVEACQGGLHARVQRVGEVGDQRVGEPLPLGGVDGVVSKIRIRAIWITGFDRKELIVPNKEFVTGQLINVNGGLDFT